MTHVAISVRDLAKQYRIGAGPAGNFREHLSRLLATPLRRRGKRPAAQTTFWALNNVSFDVHAGEVLGIIGRNGAGKSTLLKILSRITEPTRGRIDLSGRVASLLEVGTGFHGELTGRENVFLNGAILGMKREEIRRKFDEIVAFAEVDRFIDTPVKHYSSGMYLRLAFAVAAHLESEILIVDEVLAVGDAAFQKKCMGKMEETSHHGRTVLFVSHNLAAINQLCQRTIWLADGRICEDGPSYDVVTRYVTSGVACETSRTWTTQPGNERVRLVAARLRQGSAVADLVDINRELLIELDIDVLSDVRNLIASVGVVDSQGTMLFRSCDWSKNSLSRGAHRFVLEIPPQTLAEGRFSLLLQALFFDPFEMCFHENDALSFEAIESGGPTSVRGPYHGPWPGVVRLGLRWRTPERLHGEPSILVDAR